MFNLHKIIKQQNASLSEADFRLHGDLPAVESFDLKIPFLRLPAREAEGIPFAALADIAQRKFLQFSGGKLADGKAVEAIVRVPGIVDVHIVVVFRIGNRYGETLFPVLCGIERKFPAVDVERAEL